VGHLFWQLSAVPALPPYINPDHEENGLMLVFATSHNLKYETKEAIRLAGKGNPYWPGAELD